VVHREGVYYRELIQTDLKRQREQKKEERGPEKYKKLDLGLLLLLHVSTVALASADVPAAAGDDIRLHRKKIVFLFSASQSLVTEHFTGAEAKY
jgi:hypothetical protein